MLRNESSARSILQHFYREIKDKPASIKQHNNFKGGLLLHLENTFEVAKRYFPNDLVLQFLALIHDIGKARRYIVVNDIFDYRQPMVDHLIYTLEMLHEYGIELNIEELNALQMHHGGFSFFKDKMTPLAVKLHFCDSLASVNERIQ